MGERFADASVVDRAAHGGGGVMCGQVCLMDNEHGCVFIDRILNAQRH